MTAVHTEPALNRHASFDNLSGSRSSFKTTTPNALSRNCKRVFSEDFSLLHQDVFCSHPVGAVVGVPKKLRHSLSQDAANQGSQSPRWAPGLATSIRNFSPPTPKASFSLHPVLTLVPLGLGSISKYEPTGSLYIKLEQSVIPPGWSNDPISLEVDTSFNEKDEEENLKEDFKTQYNMPNPLPVLVHFQEGVWLIDGGDGKYYVYQNEEGYVGEVYERNLAKILSELGTQYNMPNPLPVIVHRKDGVWLIDGGVGKFYVYQNEKRHVGEVYDRNLPIILSKLGNRALGRTKLRRLGHLGCGPPPDYDAPWISGDGAEHDILRMLGLAGPSGARMEDGRIETFKTWPNQNQYKIFKYSIGVSSRVQQNRRSTHLDAQDELINRIIRKLDPNAVEDDEVMVVAVLDRSKIQRPGARKNIASETPDD
ncbi:hypothetical protein MMC31_008163 [Peltigera leucophlebia]|nr:hypothetical protein [Peltigera leucophlebia]